MIGRILKLYGIELRKAARNRLALLAPLFVVAVALAALPRYLNGDMGNPYQYIAFATPTALNLLGFLLLLAFTASSISSEMASGSIRHVLARPLRRHEYLLAKLLTALTFAIVLTAATAVSVWTAAAACSSLSGVHYGGELLYSGIAMIRAYLLAAALTLAPQGAGAAFALFLSTLTRNSGAATGAAVALWALLDFIKYPLHIETFVFSSYLDSPWNVFVARSDGLDADWGTLHVQCLAVCTVTFLAFSALAILVLNRRNITV